MAGENEEIPRVFEQNTTESTLSKAVNLLERSVNLLKETAINTQDPTLENPRNDDNTSQNRAIVNYRNIFPGPTVSTHGPSTSSGSVRNSTTGNTVSPFLGTSQFILNKNKASTTASTSSTSSTRLSWPGSYQSCKRSIQTTIRSRGSKGKSRLQPYKIKETWTHDFCVLAEKDQRKVPSTAHKQELREAGLGQRTIVFKDKRGDFRHIQQELFGCFKKLQQAGGFDLYRQGPSKDLIYIKPPATGYTIPFLKNDYGIKSAIIYVLPMQRNLSMEPELVYENVDDEDVEMQECYNCSKEIPLYKLREHLESCSNEMQSTDNVVEVFKDFILELISLGIQYWSML